jgi:hypothetical protein
MLVAPLDQREEESHSTEAEATGLKFSPETLFSDKKKCPLAKPADFLIIVLLDFSSIFG